MDRIEMQTLNPKPESPRMENQMDRLEMETDVGPAVGISQACNVRRVR